jgi:hypothetical protein
VRIIALGMKRFNHGDSRFSQAKHRGQAKPLTRESGLTPPRTGSDAASACFRVFPKGFEVPRRGSFTDSFKRAYRHYGAEDVLSSQILGASS